MKPKKKENDWPWYAIDFSLKAQAYNQAIDDYEAWLKETMSVKEINKVILATEWDILSGGGSMDVAIAIHRLLEGDDG